MMAVFAVAAGVGGYLLYRFIMRRQYPSPVIIAKVEGVSTDGRSSCLEVGHRG